MIKYITYDIAYNFFIKNKDRNDQITLANKGLFYGLYLNETLIGIISTNETKNTVRIKSFLVAKQYRKRGLGKELLESVLTDRKVCTAFATEYSYKLFLQCGFDVMSEDVTNLNKNNIRFMRRYNVYKPSL